MYGAWVLSRHWVWDEMRIGLTGGIGSGKSTVAKMFEERGVPIIDADQIARDLVRPGMPALMAIVDRFGPEILIDGDLDRRKLREIVFADPNARHWLDGLMHPLIYSEMAGQADKFKSPYVILVIPLLLETDHKHFVDRVLVVHADPKLQLERLVERDGISDEAAQSIMKTQLETSERLSLSEDRIENSGDLEVLEGKVEHLHRKFLALAAGEPGSSAVNNS